MVQANNTKFPAEYSVDHIEFSDNELEDFERYMCKVAKVNLEEFAKAMHDLEIDEISINNQISKIKNYLNSQNIIKDAKGNFGESQASFYLEEKEKYFILSVGWSKNPFDGHTGVDLYGVDETRSYAAYIESKAAFEDSSYRGEMKSLVTKQMCLDRLYGKSMWGDTSIEAISKAYQLRLSYDKQCASDIELTDFLFGDQFKRVGIIIHKRKKNDNHEMDLGTLYKDEISWKNNHPKTFDDLCIPTRIIDIKNKNISKWFDKWVVSADVICKIRSD